MKRKYFVIPSAVDLINQTSPEPVVVRNWRHFDVDAFRHDLSASELITNPPTNCSDMLACYKSALHQLPNRHAPLRRVRSRRRTVSPWFNADCRQMKITTRRLERIYRAAPTEEARHRWREQSVLQRHAFWQRRIEYWSTVIRESRDSKTL